MVGVEFSSESESDEESNDAWEAMMELVKMKAIKAENKQNETSSDYSKNGNKWTKLMLSTGEYADVHFLVGDAKVRVPAHRLILKNASDVFEAMFRFDAKKEKAEFASARCPVEVPDVEAAAFKVMLSFIYTEELNELNGENAMAVLYAANKYNIPGLVDRSLQIPFSELHNVFFAYAQAHLFNLEDYCNDCLAYIDRNAETLLKLEEFLQIDQKLLCEILGPVNRRQMLGPALFKIRFPLFSQEDFSEKIVPSGILTTDEVTDVEQCHINPNFCWISGGLLCPLQFPSHGRVWTFGKITMDIEKVSEFAGEKLYNNRCSKKIQINGIPWKIVVQINRKNRSTVNQKWLGFYLECDASKKVWNWSCKCSATFRIVSQKCDGAENSTGKYFNRVFVAPQCYHGFKSFISFSELMDAGKGLYDKSGDKVTLAIDLMMKEV
ncbi:hypothetical protein niasHS_011375 [Heterodera schachtii]|uniref:BTB domain-containing protein n=1 Tax=Heterodera schachtii TaxID=97005 RepID=A0ABD2IRU2_HETSC